LASERIFDDVDHAADIAISRIETLVHSIETTVRSIAFPERQYDVAIIEGGLSKYVKDWC
jgi:hypothetical protein